jgi:transposase
MLTVSSDAKIHVYAEHIDMRRSIDGLVVLLADTYKLNPQTGDLFIFTNKLRNKIILGSKWLCTLLQENGSRPILLF